MLSLPVLRKKCKFRKVTSEKSNSLQGGQALLIILLVLSVVLTMALSVVSRSVTEISITTSEEDSARALSAAEAGIEKALITTQSTGQTSLANNATYDAVVTTASSADNEFTYPKRLNAGESATFWLVSRDTNGNLSCDPEDCFRGTEIYVYWGDDGMTGPTPAVEISIFYDDSFDESGVDELIAVGTGDFSKISVVRSAFDPEGVGRPNYFNDPVTTGTFVIGSATYLYSTNNLVSDLPAGCAAEEGCILMVTVKSFYNTSDNPIGLTSTVLGGGALPAQGLNITSTGESNEAVRKINVFQSYSVPPVIFESSIFSYGDLSK